jgi:hypothetical protein
MPMPNDAYKDLADTLAPYLTDLPNADVDAIHVDESGEIAALTAKALPVTADLFVIEDSAASNAKKKVTAGNVFKTTGWIAGLDAKATPVAADSLAINDSADSNAVKESTLVQVFGAAALVSGQTAKATPVAADILYINDSADSNSAKRSTIQQAFAADALVNGLTSKATPVGADLLLINDSAASNAAKKVTVSSLPITQSQVAGILLEPAADAAVTILGTTRAVVLTVTAAATVVIANGAGLYAGQVVSLRAAAVSGGGAYTLAVQGGTLTMNATGEEPEVMRNAANDAWVVIRLGTATIV